MKRNHRSLSRSTARLPRLAVFGWVGMTLAYSIPSVRAADIAEKVEGVAQRVRSHHFHPVRDGFTYDAQLAKQGIADLDDEGWKVRMLAVRDLARLGREGILYLQALLKDTNPHVRQVSALVLGAFPADSSADALQAVLREDEDSVVRSQAAVSLGRIGSKASLALLKDRNENDTSRDVRHQCELAAYRVEKGERPVEDLAAAFAGLDESRFETVRVGKPAPDFALRDTNGKEWRLSNFKGKQPVVLIWIFADWCPVCHREFHDLTQMREAFSRQGVQVFTVECHDRYRSRVMVGRELQPRYWFTKESPQAFYLNRIWWPHLVDVGGAVGATYGVDPMAFVVHSEWINRPSTVIVDKQGIVRLAYYGTYWGDRPTIEQTLDMIVKDRYEFEHPKSLMPSR